MRAVKINSGVIKCICVVMATVRTDGSGEDGVGVVTGVVTLVGVWVGLVRAEGQGVAVG